MANGGSTTIHLQVGCPGTDITTDNAAVLEIITADTASVLDISASDTTTGVDTVADGVEIDTEVPRLTL